MPRVGCKKTGLQEPGLGNSPGCRIHHLLLYWENDSRKGGQVKNLPSKLFPLQRRPVWPLFLIGLFAPISSSSAASLGSVTGYTKNGQTVQFAMQNGTMNITVCSPKMARVWCVPGKTFIAKSYTSVAGTAWDSVPYAVSEPSSGEIRIATSAIAVSVATSTGAITFKDLSGTVIAQDSGNDMAASSKFPDAPYSFSTPFTISNGEAIYGLGEYENDSSVTYNGRNVTLYPQQYTSVYTIPLAVSSKGYGILWDNSLWSIQWQQNAAIMRVGADCAPYLDYYFIYGPAIDSVISGYRSITGKPPLFGKWAYGFHQSKNRYASQAELLNIASQFRTLQIPLDNIVVDWQWWTTWGSHQFNTNDWPNPADMNDSLHRALHCHSLLSVWPAFASGSANYNELQAAGCLLDSGYGGRYYDPFSPECDSIYWRQIRDQIMPKGFDGLWHDASEGDMYQDLDWRSPAYSTMVCKTTYQGRRQYNPNQRVYTLTRSAWAGQQQYAAVTWSGDIDTAWSTLRKQIPVGINFCMSGLPYWADDIGGFWTQCNAETMVRWFQYGTFFPIFRVHGSADKEPWRYGATAQAILTNYIKLRYRLLPYIYSVAWMVTDQGYTMMRGLIMDFQTDPNVKKICSQFMFGPALMINPVTTPGTTSRQVYLPSTKWYDFWAGTSVSGGATITSSAPLATIPIYVRAGSIVPMGPDLMYATEKSADTIELRVYPGADGTFTLYEDEDDNYNYEKGQYATIPFVWSDAAQTLTIGARQGSFNGMLAKRVFNVVTVSQNHGSGQGFTANPDAQVVYAGGPVSVRNGRVTGAGSFLRACAAGVSWQLWATGMQSSSVKIHFSVPQDAANKPVLIRLYNVRGGLVQTLMDGVVGMGGHTLGLNDAGAPRSGRYLCRIQGQGFDKTVGFIVAK
jgi:alpha-D-xyloside xylohydrolase